MPETIEDLMRRFDERQILKREKEAQAQAEEERLASIRAHGLQVVRKTIVVPTPDPGYL